VTTIEQGQTSVPTGTWTVDPVHSSVGFAVRYTGTITFKGEFGDFDATLADGRLEGTARVASIEVDDPNLAAHLQTPDFFDAERNPELRFRSETIERDDDRFQVGGELTLKGVTRPVELAGTISGPVTDAYGKQRIGIELETVVNRHDFGISWNMDLPDGSPALADDVAVSANLAFVQAEGQA
jgi:polyisoprenoid-binding protein YceI